MGHFAKVENGVVTNVIVADQEDIVGLDGQWIQTSYNTWGGVHSQGGVPLRKNYAGIGFLYDAERDAFILPKPYASWVLNEDTCLWDAPVAMPTDGGRYTWNEDTQNWDAVPETTA
jgi:hypothetical protein